MTSPVPVLTTCAQCAQTDTAPKGILDHDTPAARRVHYDCLPKTLLPETDAFVQQAVNLALNGTQNDDLRTALEAISAQDGNQPATDIATPPADGTDTTGA